MGFAPVVDIFGVYVDAWIICGIVGLVVAYGVALLFSVWKGTQQWGASALLFCSLTVTVAVVTWWFIFRDF